MMAGGPPRRLVAHRRGRRARWAATDRDLQEAIGARSGWRCSVLLCRKREDTTSLCCLEERGRCARPDEPLATGVKQTLVFHYRHFPKPPSCPSGPRKNPDRHRRHREGYKKERSWEEQSRSKGAERRQEGVDVGVESAHQWGQSGSMFPPTSDARRKSSYSEDAGFLASTGSRANSTSHATGVRRPAARLS